MTERNETRRSSNDDDAFVGITEAIVSRILTRFPADATSQTVFLSGAVGDTVEMEGLRAELLNRGFKVLTIEGVASDGPFELTIKRVITQADIAIFLISGPPSFWLNQAIEEAERQNNKMILSIVLEPNESLPEQLKEFDSLRMTDFKHARLI